LFVPVFFVVVRRLIGDRSHAAESKAKPLPEHGGADA